MDELNSLISEIYAASLKPDSWPQVLDLVATAVGARGTVLNPLDRRQGQTCLTSVNLEEANFEYENRWWHLDSRVATAQAIGVKPGVVVSDAVLLKDVDRRTDPFCQEFLERYGLGEAAAFIAVGADGGMSSIAVHRARGKGAYEGREIALFRTLAPHLGRAFTLTTAIAAANACHSGAMRVLEHVNLGMVVLDRRGSVRQLNAIAETLLGGCLQLGSDRLLRTVSRRDQAKLDSLIAAVLHGNDPAASLTLMLRDPAETAVLLIEAIPIRSGEAGLDMVAANGGGALLVLRDPFGRAARFVVQRLEQLGLTRREAHVAEQVGRGLGPREAALELGMAEATVRVHLRNIFAKLQIERLSQLAILVTRLDSTASF